jgi:undecaprenyl diphosphate synthase
MPRTLPVAHAPRLHVAIILDGNGRWAEARGLPRSAGHRAGVEAVRRVADAAPGLGIHTLTLYAFSVHNWQRPRSEVEALFETLRGYFAADAAACAARGVRVTVFGRRDRLPAGLVAAIASAEAQTAAGPGRPAPRLHLRLALDYSAREAILRTAQRLGAARDLTPERFGAALTGDVGAAGEGVPDVDLLIRTGGERRLSDFLLWEIAHAELLFTPVAWPDFTAAHLEAALEDFRERDRRFGGLRQAV